MQRMFLGLSNHSSSRPAPPLPPGQPLPFLQTWGASDEGGESISGHAQKPPTGHLEPGPGPQAVFPSQADNNAYNQAQGF